MRLHLLIGTCWLLIGGLGLASGGLGLASGDDTVTVGKQAPDFVATGIDGKQFKLSEKIAAGKNISLLFSRAHW